MTTLLFLLSFLVLTDESEQLATYITLHLPVVASTEGNNTERKSPIEVSCEVFPKTLTAGDALYVRVAAKNISQEPIVYRVAAEGALGCDFRFFCGHVGLLKGGSSTSVPARVNGFEISLLSTGVVAIPPVFKDTLLPGSVSVSGPQTVFIPPLIYHGQSLWARDDFSKEEKYLMVFGTSLGRLHEEPRKSERYSIRIMQELRIKPRPKEELQLMKEWYGKTWFYACSRHSDYQPSPDAWREFEEKLTPGTLRNRIRVVRTITDIMQDANKGKRQKMFDEMLKWIDELHPLEKEGLTQYAYFEAYLNSFKHGEEFFFPFDEYYLPWRFVPKERP